MIKIGMHIICLLCFFVLNTLPAQANRMTSLNKLHIKKILLVVAMDKEAQPIISMLNLHKITHAIYQDPK